MKPSVLSVARAILVRTIWDALDAPRSPARQYGIGPGYRHRKRARYLDDTAQADEWQREVYMAAADLMRSEGLTTVYDVGCGSGYKLVHYLGEYDTIGFDLEPTVMFLRKAYPDRAWHFVSLDDRSFRPADLVVCADVVEHVDNPDTLLDFLYHVTGRYLVLSTPDRDLIYPKGHRRHGGPPWNIMHLREWSFAELAAYVDLKFEIVEHRVTNKAQGTQMMICRKRLPDGGVADDMQAIASPVAGVTTHRPTG
jgi:SAM-dependent methyltransferase